MNEPITPKAHIKHIGSGIPCGCWTGSSDSISCDCGASYELKEVMEFGSWRCYDCGQSVHWKTQTEGIEMSATQELIAAALTAADELDFIYKHAPIEHTTNNLREACARAIVQPAAPDMAEVERLLDLYADHVFSDGLLGSKVMTEHAATARSALLDYVRGVLAERDALMLEFCPQEMTEVQKEKWARNQQPVSAAEVPMPEPVVHNLPSGKWSYNAGQMRTYGDAREAAGYARGKAENAKDAERYRWLRDTGVASWRPFALREGYSASAADDAIDAALRGEVKP